jgi:ADP-ribosyl-[dinitrogen reductase] hydrolase
MTFAPSEHQAQAMIGVWACDLDLDLRAIRDWGAETLISLLEPWEFEELGSRHWPRVRRRTG